MPRTRIALAATLSSLLASSPAHARPITLDQALAEADKSPSIAAASASVAEAEGDVEQAGTYTYNPSLTLAGGPAFGPGERAYDFDLSLGHAIELGGKRGARHRVASAERDAAKENADAMRAVLHAEVRRAFYAALVAEQVVDVTTEDETAARELKDAAAERLRLGAATQTELNVALAGLGRATATRKAAERDLVLARSGLAAAIGVTADVEPTGELPTFSALPSDEDALVSAALAGRRDLAATDRMKVAREADVDLADALGWPDPEVSVSWSRSAIEDIDTVLVAVRIDLPLWNRNQGGRRAARAAEKRATIELDAARRDVERDVRTAVRRYRAATEAVAAFDRDVIGTLDDNLKLARESLAAGKLNLLELNTVRRDLVESQLTFLAAVAEAVEARASVELAIGHSLEETP